MAEKLPHEVAIELITKEVTRTKIVSQTGNTGISWFQGKDRLCKVLYTKRGLSLEINVELPKDVETEYNLIKISPATAHAKHLGTMKYHFKTNEIQGLAPLVKHIVTAFKLQLEEKIKAEEKQG